MSTVTKRRAEAVFALLGGVGLLGVVASGCGVGDVPASGANADSSIEVLAANEGFDEAAGPVDGGPGPVDTGDVKFGTLTGRITFTGAVPSLPPPSVPADAQTVCKPDKIGNDKLVVGADGGLANVFVYLDKPPSAKPAPTGEEGEATKQVFNNLNCRFEPHCMVIGIRETIDITNTDAVVHNTHTYGVRNDTFNQSIGEGGRVELTYTKPEMVSVKCDVHSWMQAYHLVVRDPDFAAITDESGNFTIEGLQHGTHKVTILHNSGVKEVVTVTVGDDTPPLEKSYSAGDFTLAGGRRAGSELVVTLGR